MNLLVAGIALVAMLAAGVLAAFVLKLDDAVKDLQRKVEKTRRLMLVNRLATREEFTNEYLGEDEKW